VRCDQCAPKYYKFPQCIFCDPPTTCSAHGSCTVNGTCACSITPGVVGYAGVSCSTCAPDYYAYSVCKYCTVNNCNKQGTCTMNGDCVCNATFTGALCNQCKTNFFSSACLPCPGGVGNACNLKGTCDWGITRLGKCACNAPYRGPACDWPTVTTVDPVNGANTGGSYLTINGFYFGAAIGTVTIGGTVAPANSWDATQIIVVTPQRLGVNLPVVVTRADAIPSGNATKYSYDGEICLFSCLPFCTSASCFRCSQLLR
jgi:hypothetical protein